MKFPTPSLRAMLIACAPAIVVADPVLTTPGTATWETILGDNGTKTIFTITDDTVFEWEGFNLESGNEIVFDFIGGNQVVNYLNGDNAFFINGTITSNGSVSFFSPSGSLYVNGDITAANVTLSTLDVDPADVLDGNGFLMQEGSVIGNELVLTGEVHATNGSVLLASRELVLQGGSIITASDAVKLAGTDRARVPGSGAGRMTDIGSEGFVLHMGAAHATKIEVRAGREIHSHGTLDAGKGRIFMEVGSDGRVFSDNRALVVGDLDFSGTILPSQRASFNDADAPATVSDATLRIPTLKRPGGAAISEATALRTSSAVSASSSVNSKSDRKPSAENKTLMARSSFFGMRGGRGGSGEIVSREQ